MVSVAIETIYVVLEFGSTLESQQLDIVAAIPFGQCLATWSGFVAVVR